MRGTVLKFLRVIPRKTVLNFICFFSATEQSVSSVPHLLGGMI
jgi:hypothetical protein